MLRTDHVKEMMNRFQSSFFFYDLDQFETHLSQIKKTLHPDIKIWYATKANPLSEILCTLHGKGFGIDVASLGELKQARSSGFQNKKIIATGPAKSKNYLARLLEAEVGMIVLESLNQLKDLNDVAQKLGVKQNALLRIQLDWNEGESVLGGSKITPFGLGVSDWIETNLKNYPNVNIKGVHCFQWGNILDAMELKKVWTPTIEAARDLSLKMGFKLDVMDLGGGLGMSYKDDQELQFKDVHDVLVELKAKYELNEIWLELGRYSIGKFGSYFTKIVDIKSVRGKEIIVTEGGINHIARPALVGEAFPCEAFMNSPLETKPFAIHGPLCTALDFLGEFSLPKDLKVGDWLEFKKAGAYGFTESMPNFLCHDLPGEAILLNNELIVPRAPKSHLDWMV